MATASGCVERIVFRNDETGFVVARLSNELPSKRPSTTTIVGTMPSIQEGERLSLSGDWETHPVHGRNFRVSKFQPELPEGADQIYRYLSSGAVRGIGPVTARRIVERFGERSVDVIDQQPEVLRQIPGVSARRLTQITSSWIEQKRLRELMIFLQEHGIGLGFAAAIQQKYGDDAAQVVREDPYRLARDIRGIGFRTADAIARAIGIGPRSPSRLVAGLQYTLSQAAEAGHVSLTTAQLFARCCDLLGCGQDELEPALLELLRSGEAVLDAADVYLAAFYHAETGAASRLHSLQSSKSSLLLDAAIDVRYEVQKAAGIQGLALASGQLQAAERALSEKVSILTGGPGTGKTSTLRTIIAGLDRQEISYCLCAPTGRAAKRAAEASGTRASTIHRLLEFQPGTNTFGFDDHRPLPYDYVIVDEVSMLDILLFYHLLKAIRPEAHLLLVGDADQLPSVGPGCVLRDLIDSGVIPTTTLTDLFRQARSSRMIVAAHAINHGEVPRVENGEDTDLFFVTVRDEQATGELIRQIVQERIPERFGLGSIEDVQVIAPMHKGAAGVGELNKVLQAALNPEASTGRSVREIHRGDKVMQIRNNYEKDVFNGDVGRVASIEPENYRLTVSFSSGSDSVDVDYAGSELDDLVLAYAISVHKAQGSEFPAVVMPLVTRHAVLLQRNLLYTALTRARQLCVLVGSQRALEMAVRNPGRVERNTGLARRIAEAELVPA